MLIRNLLLSGIITLSITAMPAMAGVNVNLDIDIAPPAPRVEIIPAPRHGYVWAPGYWLWKGQRHVWVAGHWMTARPGHHWIPEHWEKRHGRYHFEPGHWEPAAVHHEQERHEHEREEHH